MAASGGMLKMGPEGCSLPCFHPVLCFLNYCRDVTTSYLEQPSCLSLLGYGYPFSCLADNNGNFRVHN